MATKQIEKVLKNIVEIESSICIAYESTNVDIYDFDFRQFFQVKPIISESKYPVVLRIGAIVNYEELFNELKSLGIDLINNIEQHQKASLLPEWYPHIKDYTPKSKWYDQLPGTEAILENFDFPIFLKGERQTNKHKRSMSIATNLTELENILSYWKADDILGWQRLICREFVKLEKLVNLLGTNYNYRKNSECSYGKTKWLKLVNIGLKLTK